MASRFTQTLQIGFLGHPALLRCNRMAFQELQSNTPHSTFALIPVSQAVQVAQLDGLLISGWHYPTLCRRICPLQKSILAQQDHLSLWGISAGAALLGRGNLLPVIDCDITIQKENRFHTSILELPDCSGNRFIGTFISDMQFASLAPNLGVLCQNQSCGAIAIRQGNHLVCSFAAEFTPSCYLYPYWLEMVASLKESQI